MQIISAPAPHQLQFIIMPRSSGSVCMCVCQSVWLKPSDGVKIAQGEIQIKH